jgi:hypothetical protein
MPFIAHFSNTPDGLLFQVTTIYPSSSSVIHILVLCVFSGMFEVSNVTGEKRGRLSFVSEQVLLILMVHYRVERIPHPAPLNVVFSPTY